MIYNPAKATALSPSITPKMVEPAKLWTDEGYGTSGGAMLVLCCHPEDLGLFTPSGASFYSPPSEACT